jgi:hypothetical protein
MMSYEFKKLLVDIAYANLGLVPPSHYPRSSIGSLNESLSSMDEVSRRKATRKFRKLLRLSRKGKKGDWNKSSHDSKQSAVRAHVFRKYVLSIVTDNDE